MREVSLFSEVPRSYLEPAQHGESDFAFYDRSALPTAGRIRRLLESWYRRYPEEKRPALRNALQESFLPAFSELFMHECLLRLYGSVEVDPLVGGGRTPDFAVVEEDGRRVYVEVTVVSEESEEERGKRRALDQFFDYVNALPVPDYFVWFRRVHVPAGATPSARRFGQWLQAWIQELDYELVLAAGTQDRIDLLPRRLLS